MTYLDEPESAKKYFINFAKTKIGPNSYSMIDVNSLGFDDSKLINRTLSKAMEEVNNSNYKTIRKTARLKSNKNTK